MQSKLFLRMMFVLLVAGMSGGARPEVLDAETNGFTIRHQVLIQADRFSVFEAAVGSVGEWWSSDHTVSGNSANLYIDARVSGCFCENLGENAGLVHMSVSFVNPGVIVRFTGGLGPLGLMGVAGNMTWEFDEAETGTVLTLQYAVGGYMPGGLDTVAGPVDGVLIEQMTRLKAFVETGSPSEG